MSTVAVNGKQWTVTVATTPAELAAGLSGIASIPAGTGMYFDMGSAQSSIAINMADMLFSLDIVFIDSSGVVVGILREVEPGEAAAFDAGGGLGARYFLEVNAEEAEDVSVGDIAIIQIISNGPAPGTLDLNALINPLITIMVMGMMMKMMVGPSGVSRIGAGIA